MTPGTLLASRYELVRQLGHGGMGEVWLGFDTVLGREVAVKVVDFTMTEDPMAAERFRRETQAAAALSHDNVVRVFDSATEGSTAFLVMELLSGPTLADLIRDRAPLPLALALELAEQTAAALAATHRLGIVHRDIKPSNLMLDERGRLKVVDFGIARLTESTAARLTATSTVMGSAAYMAPEQATGQPATAATDLYALGCVLMALLTGQPPFDAEHPLAVLQQHMTAPPPPLRGRRPDVPSALEDLIDQLLAKAPERRPHDAELVREQLARIRRAAATRTQPMPAMPVPTEPLTVPLPTGTSAMPAPADRPPSARPSPRRWRQDGRVPAAGAAMLLVLLGATAVISDLGGFGQTDTSPPSSQVAETPGTAKTGTPEGADIDDRPEEPAQPSPESAGLPTSLAELRDAIESAGTSDDEVKAGDDLLRRVEDIEKRLADEDTKDLGRRLDEIARKLDELVRQGKLSPEDADPIRRALTEVEASVS